MRVVFCPGYAVCGEVVARWRRQAAGMSNYRRVWVPGGEPQRRKRLHKMGAKSEAFCRLAIEIMSGNPGILPVRFDLAAVQRDLAAWDALRPRRIRMLRLFERMMDTEMALGSDMMANSVEAYAFLRVSGKSAGLDALRKQLAVRFKGKRSRSEVSEVPEDSPEESATAEV